MLDILIKGAAIMDGLGGKAYKGDLAIQDGRIVEMGALPQAQAREIIDARSLAAAPGFIDMHTHSDSTLPVGPRAESKIRQGVTTEVTGMCGGSLAPLTEKQRQEARGQATGYRKLLAYDWLTFGEYLAHLRAQGVAVNVVALAGHGTLRVGAMGHSAQAPTEAELDHMKAALAQAMDEGAWGFSTGLIYAPGFFAKTDELIALARVAADKGGFYFSHIRGEGATLLDALAEAIAIGEQGGLPVQIAHYKASGRSHWGKAAAGLEMVDAARERGVDIMTDMYPYVAASTGLGSLIPDWAHEGGREALLGRLRDPETRAAIHGGVTQGIDPLEGEGQWAKVLISVCSALPGIEGKTIAQLAQERGTPPVDTVLDLLVEAEANVSMIHEKMSAENVRMQLRHEWMMIGSDGYALAAQGPLSEGKPHPRSYGTFPRVLAKYARQEGVLTMEEAVHRMTGLPAARLGLEKRGLLRPGYWADVVLFDPETVADRATYAEPHQYPVGIPYVLVNGQITIEKGEHTGVLAGQILSR